MAGYIGMNLEPNVEFLVGFQLFPKIYIIHNWSNVIVVIFPCYIEGNMISSIGNITLRIEAILYPDVNI